MDPFGGDRPHCVIWNMGSNRFMPAEAQWSFFLFLKKWTLRKCQVTTGRPERAFRWVSLHILLSSGNKYEVHTEGTGKTREKRLCVFTYTEKDRRILSGSSYYSVADIGLFRHWPFRSVEVSRELGWLLCKPATGLGPCWPAPLFLQSASKGDSSNPKVWLMHFHPHKHKQTHTHTERPFHFLSRGN